MLSQSWYGVPLFLSQGRSLFFFQSYIKSLEECDVSHTHDIRGKRSSLAPQLALSGIHLELIITDMYFLQ